MKGIGAFGKCIHHYYGKALRGAHGIIQMMGKARLVGDVFLHTYAPNRIDRQTGRRTHAHIQAGSQGCFKRNEFYRSRSKDRQVDGVQSDE